VPRGTLNREALAAAAIELLERDGPRALSMRRLGEDVGVEAMSLYHYVTSREDLLDAMFEALIARSEPLPEDGGLEEVARTFAHSLRRVALAHPRTFPLVANRPLRTPLVLARADALLGALHAAGLGDADAVAGLRLLGSYVIGYLLDELALDSGAGARWSGELPPGLSALAAVGSELAPDKLEAHFDRGIELILVALRGAAG
jgi:AcrR family transcriptional regulator